MKNIAKITGMLALLLVSGSCKDSFLDEIHPTRESADAFFRNDDEAQQAAVAMYEYMNNLHGATGDSFLGAFDMLRGDNLTLPKNAGNNGLINWLTLNYNAETNRANDGWRDSYQAIYRANWIIGNLEGNDAVSSEVKSRVLGEAYMMRGYAYLNLAHLFEEVPLMLEQTTEATYYPEKATSEQVWAQVVKDLEESIKGLPAPKANFVDGRGNKGVAHALLARAYLYRTRPGNAQFWDKVKEHTAAVENLGVYGLEPMDKPDEFRDIFVYTKEDRWVKNREMIWAAGYVYGPIYGGLPFLYRNLSGLGNLHVQPVGRRAIMVVNENEATYLPGNGRDGRARYAASPALSNIMIDYNKLGDHRTEEFLFYPKYNDYALRTSSDPTSVFVKEVVNTDSLYKKAIETNGAAGEYLHIKKFAIKEFIGTNIWDGGYHHPLMYPIIRYADVLLMRAEAEFNLGNEGSREAVS